MGKLESKKVAILTETGFEEIELTSPKEALEKEGATVHVVSPAKSLKSWDKTDWGKAFEVDKSLEDANPEEYDALLLPGGVINPDKLRRNEKAIDFVKSFFEAGKPISAICHGPQVLIETGALQGRALTSFPSIKTDLKNAGARWEDVEVLVDKGLTTSRSPADLNAFNAKVIEEIAEGVHQEQKTV